MVIAFCKEDGKRGGGGGGKTIRGGRRRGEGWGLEGDEGVTKLKTNVISDAGARGTVYERGHSAMLHPLSGTGCPTRFTERKTLLLFGIGESRGLGSVEDCFPWLGGLSLRPIITM